MPGGCLNGRRNRLNYTQHWHKLRFFMRSLVMKSVLPRSCAGAGTTADTDLTLQHRFWQYPNISSTPVMVCWSLLAHNSQISTPFGILRRRAAAAGGDGVAEWVGCIAHSAGHHLFSHNFHCWCFYISKKYYFYTVVAQPVQFQQRILYMFM